MNIENLSIFLAHLPQEHDKPKGNYTTFTLRNELQSSYNAAKITPAFEN